MGYVRVWDIVKVCVCGSFECLCTHPLCAVVALAGKVSLPSTTVGGSLTW